jgi:Nucleotidyl transferase AbiEii toxin, Type IV TA system
MVRGGVDFVVVGGYAAIAHGAARLTHDLDICYAPDPENLKALGSVLVEIGAKLRGIEDDVPFVPDDRTLRHTTILTLDSPHGPIDLLVRPSGSPPYAELRRRALEVEVDGVAVPVASIDDLIAMKKAAGRDKDLLDLAELEAIKRLSG